LGIYDCILVLGGDTRITVNELKRLSVDVEKFKKDVLYIGTSIVLWLWLVFLYDYNRDTKEVSFLNGFLPSNNEIYLVHSDNLDYTDIYLGRKIRKSLPKKTT